MPSNKIAPPSFVTGPNNKLLTVDVFSGTSGGIVNSIASLAAKYDVDLIGMLRAGAAAAQLIPVVEGIANGKLLMNPQAAIARILTASNTLVNAVGGPSVSTSFNSLSDGTQSDIYESGYSLGVVNTSVDGVVGTVSNGNVSDISGLGSIINSFAGSDVFLMVDTQALAGMAAGVINQCAKYGISGAFQQMVKNITNPKVLNAIVRQTLPNLVVAGDIGGLQSLSLVASTAGIAAVNPRMLSSFTTTYSRSASGSYQQSLPNQDLNNWNAINGCYSSADPNWNTAVRVGDPINDPTIDITDLQGGTDDFNSALTAGVYQASANNVSATTPDTVTPFYSLAPVYASTDVDTQLKTLYPNTYIDPALRSTPVSVEPTQLQTGVGATPSAATSPTAVTIVSGLNTSITSAQASSNEANGYNTGAIVFDDDTSTIATPAPTPISVPANDPVGAQPNAATYKTINGNLYSVTPGSGEAWSSTAINWGGGVAFGDGQYNYTPVYPNGQ